MNSAAITCDEFIDSARNFVTISDRLHDGWNLFEINNEPLKTYIKKESYVSYENNGKQLLLKAEFVIFYNLSYGVPSFSFNVWNSSGVLLSLEKIRKLSFLKISTQDFYSVITQQEHPIFFKPYFIMHPCHTEGLLAAFRSQTKNIIVTFLGLITPLLRINLPMEYGL